MKTGRARTAIEHKHIGRGYRYTAYLRETGKESNMKSMTGYYSIQEEHDGKNYTVEIKSVNSRYYDPNIRLSHSFNYLEAPVRELIGHHIQRGKVDLSLEVREKERKYRITVDRGLVTEYAQACRQVARAAGITEDPSLTDILRADGIIMTEPVIDRESILKHCIDLVERALKGFERIRMHDGKSVARDIAANLKLMKQYLRTIRSKTRNSVPDLRKQLLARLERIVGKDVDKNMIITEAGILANKLDINEELSRLDSHLDLFEKTMKNDEPVGRTLDFISQEINREVNTIGSKQADFAIAEQVVMLKSLLEKIREQIRNIE